MDRVLIPDRVWFAEQNSEVSLHILWPFCRLKTWHGVRRFPQGYCGRQDRGVLDRFVFVWLRNWCIPTQGRWVSSMPNLRWGAYEKTTIVEESVGLRW